MDKHGILNEIARPSTLDGFKCSKEQKQKFQEYIDKQDIPHLAIMGLQGLGKSTLARILIKNIDCDFIKLNAVEDRSIETIREKIGTFAAAGTFKPLKIVLLEESTHLLESAQVLLLDMMETYSAKTRFILTGNYPERLIPPLRSRLQEIVLSPAPKKEMAIHVFDILTQENIEAEPKDVANIINSYYPDLRKIFNECQKYTINGKLTLDKFKVISEESNGLILEELSKPKPNINVLRQIISDSNKNDYEDVYKFLYENIDKFASKNIAETIINLEEGLYRSQTRLNKEINICATFSRIISSK